MGIKESFLTDKHLKIGKIPYANLFPIFYTLKNRCDCSAYEFIEGVPSALNRLLRNGEIDISPSSSIEYLRHEDRYVILDGHSVSSLAPIGSILLFSKKPIETLDGSTVLTSSQSEASVALLNIIFKKFYRIDCRLKSVGEPLLKALQSYPAYMLIGDEALRAVGGYKLRVTTEDKDSGLQTPRPRSLASLREAGQAAKQGGPNSELFIYDLGDIWYKNTGLPFVFALWIARKDCCIDKPSLFEKFKRDLETAKVQALKNLKSIATKSELLGLLSEDEIVSYWQGISYDLNDEHKRGLELFRRYAEELGLI
jgi:chorismate dehydratase